jgi:hypothetical protein
MVDPKLEALTQAVNAPRMFFLSRKSLADNPERVQELLRLTPIQGIFVASELDALLAAGLCDQVMGMHQPFAVVADFPFEVATLVEGGKLIPGELPEVTPEKQD